MTIQQRTSNAPHEDQLIHEVSKARREMASQVSFSNDGFSFTPGDSGRGHALNRQRGRSVGDIEELTRMEKILDEWTPYASLDHVGVMRVRKEGQVVKQGQSGRGVADKKHNLLTSHDADGMQTRYDRPAPTSTVFEEHRKGGFHSLPPVVNASLQDFRSGAGNPQGNLKAARGYTSSRNEITQQRETKDNYNVLSTFSSLPDHSKPHLQNGYHNNRYPYDRRGGYISENALQEHRQYSMDNGARNYRSQDYISAWHDSEELGWGSSKSSSPFVNDDKWIVRDIHGQFYSENIITKETAKRKNTPWPPAADNRQTHSDRKGRGGSVESRVARKKEELQRGRKETSGNWLTEDTIRKLEDYHSDEYSETIGQDNKIQMANKSTQVKFSKKPSKAMTFDREHRNWKIEEGANEDEREAEEDFHFVKRGIRFWDGDKSQGKMEGKEEGEGERRRKMVRIESWKQKEEERRVRQEEWMYREEEDTVWVKKADKSIRMKNQKERKLEAERAKVVDGPETRTGTRRGRIYGVKRGPQDRGNYWRIGHGDKGLSKELQVIRVSDEQLTSF